MIAEPYKIKEVKKTRSPSPSERRSALRRAGYNTFRLPSDRVSFDMVARGMSAWSHFQKAAYMVGDEAYAGSRNYVHLGRALERVFGLERFVPTHNRIGAEKLLVTTSVEAGDRILHNRGQESLLAAEHGAVQIDLTGGGAGDWLPLERFGADLDLERLERELSSDGVARVAYVHVEACPEAWNGQPISMTNLRAVCRLAEQAGVLVVLDLSGAVENAWLVSRHEEDGRAPAEILREMAALADVCLLDASEAPRADAGGFVTSRRDEVFERLRNQVVVFEGLHTYGGMTGRAMEVFAVGLDEMLQPAFVEWHQQQVERLHRDLVERGVPSHRGAKGVALDARAFLPHLGEEEQPVATLAACLYLQGGIRARLEGLHRAATAPARRLALEVPRAAYTDTQLRFLAACVGEVHARREQVRGLRLVGEPEFVDQAVYEPTHGRLSGALREGDGARPVGCEAYKIAIVEPIAVADRTRRRQALEEAGYNTFLLPSEDVYIDLLTDSGTSAMSCYQWEGMTDTQDTPYSNRHYLALVEDFREILGFEHVMVTHQGRAAEHIMSQCMIRPGQAVLSNMYFTTTRLHQELPGGRFVDVIVDEAHDPESDFPWKGNVDLGKMQRAIEDAGQEGVAYLSLEMSVNMAGGQPFSMDNLAEVSALCQHHGIPLMFDATRCVENAAMIQRNDPRFAHRSVRSILREMLSHGDGCTVSCKKDFLVNMGGLLACNDAGLAERFRRMLRIWEGDLTNGGMDPKDIEALHRGLLDSLEDDYIRQRVEQTQALGRRLAAAGVPIVSPPGSHAVFLDARRFLPHLDQDEYPAQALAAAIYLETGVRTMERGNVSKGRNPATGENFRPPLELVRCTLPRRVYTESHIDFVVEGIARLHEKRERITGLEFTYEPAVLRFFQGRFRPREAWDL